MANRSARKPPTGCCSARLTLLPAMPWSVADSGHGSVKRDQIIAASAGTAKSRRQPSRRLLEDGMVGVALRRRVLAVEVGIERPEGELAAVRILEPQLAVAHDSGAVQHSAGAAPAGGHRPK